jgi:predicted nucleic acid-binding protein
MGMRLQDPMDAAQKLSPRERLDLISAVSRSLQHAYEETDFWPKEETPDDLIAYIYRQRALEANLEKYVVLLFDIALCRLGGEIRAECRAKGHPISPQDAWIAATALQYALPLVTHNRKDFDLIDKLEVIAETI